MNDLKSGQIMQDKKECRYKCCVHKNLVPLEYSFYRKSFPPGSIKGHKAEPFYNSVNVINADTMRVKSFLCLDCKCEIKAPKPDSIRKDIL
ncbi:MAG: hypothetical protein SVO01_00785 [Thermotogota bacterium]|nr:hypothetical protein [Thermotogota bacterium]